jgi:hypothetical protein
MLQVLVEFQFKEVNKKQMAAIADAIQVFGILWTVTRRIARVMRMTRSTRELRMFLNARLSSTGPTTGEGPHYIWR